MAKPLLPPRRRYPGRSAQRVKPGDIIKAMLIANPNGVSIGDCHREYIQQLLRLWQEDERLKITHGVSLSDLAIKRHPRNTRKQQAYIARKERALERVAARKRPPNAVTAANFSRFFHYLIQLGYIRHKMERDPKTKEVIRVYAPPEMRGGAEPNVEPASIYIMEPDGESKNWNNPAEQLR